MNTTGPIYIETTTADRVKVAILTPVLVIILIPIVILWLIGGLTSSK